jgi:hypothetical protein
MHPFPEEADASVARPIEELRAEERPDIRQDRARARGMQPVAPVVEAVAGVFEARITTTVTSARQVQLGVKVLF